MLTQRRSKYAPRPVPVLLAVLAIIMTGCALTSAEDPESANSEAKKPEPVIVNIFAGRNINQDLNGQPLALVVKMFLLDDINAFERASYDSFLNEQTSTAALGNDIVHSREVLFVPQQKYRIKLPAEGSGRYLGIVALFRNPAAGRWRQAFRLAPEEDNSITIGLHACAMTVSSGAAVNPLGIALNQLSNTRCPE